MRAAENIAVASLDCGNPRRLACLERELTRMKNLARLDYSNARRDEAETYYNTAPVEYPYCETPDAKPPRDYLH